MPTIIPIPTSGNSKPIPESDLKGMAILSTLIFLFVLISIFYKRIKYKSWHEVELNLFEQSWIIIYLLFFVIFLFIYFSNLIGKLL
jgi:Flp pilus assembly protein protease CpaA